MKRSARAGRWTRRLWRFRRPLPEVPAEPEESPEERSARDHVRRTELEPPSPEPEVAETLDEPARGSAVTTRPLEVPGHEEPEPEPAPPDEPPVPVPAAEAPPPEPRVESPPPAPSREPEPLAPPTSPPAASPPREWNLWELERRARERAGTTARDEEWTALFVHLRQFANAEGVLPTEFDGLVRESFSELIPAA